MEILVDFAAEMEIVDPDAAKKAHHPGAGSPKL